MAEDRYNCNLVVAILVAAVGSGFQHGYNTGVINTPHAVLKDWLNETYTCRTGKPIDDNLMPLMWGITASIMNIGGMIGGLMMGLFVKKFGPKNALLCTNSIVLVPGVLMTFSPHFDSIETMIIGRFLIGVVVGLFAGLCPIYLWEISPVGLRGTISRVYQLMVAISILISQILGLDYILGSEYLWNILFSVVLMVSALQGLTLGYFPDSPKYLITQRGDAEAAQKALKFLRMSDNVEDEMSAIQAEADANRALPKITSKEMCQERYLKQPLMIAVVLMLAQQFTGINAVFFYSTHTFSKAGIEEYEAQYATIGIGCINLLMTIVSFYLVDIAGRKPLLLIGLGGMAIDTVLLSLSLRFADSPAFIAVGLTFMYVILFVAGVGSVPWFLVSEMFSQAARPVAMSLAVPVNWIANFVVTLAFPTVEAVIGPFVFLIFAAFNVVFFVLIWILVPETKNKSIEEITSRWK